MDISKRYGKLLPTILLTSSSSLLFITFVTVHHHINLLRNGLSILVLIYERNANMAFFFGQFWGQLPTIYETYMGDMSGTSPSGDYNNAQGPRPSATQNSATNQYNENDITRGRSGGAHSGGQQQFSQGQSDPFGLAALANSLPDATYQNYNNASAQRYSSGPSGSPMMYQYQNVPQFAGQQNMGQHFQSMPYGYQPQYQGMYAPGQAQQSHGSQSTSNNASQFYQGQGFMGQSQQMSPPFIVQPGQYGLQGQLFPVSSSGTYGGRGTYMGDMRQPGQMRGNEFLGGPPGGVTPGRSSSIGKSTLWRINALFIVLTISVIASSNQSSVVRGPPRKPRQSGRSFTQVIQSLFS